MDYIYIIFLIGVMVVMYVVMFVPQKKKEKQLNQLRNNLEIGDEVVTESGIVGKVISAKDPESVTIETGADKTRLKFKRWAIIGKEDSSAK
jgi:preprotein translocase, yajC subunit